MRSEYDSFLLVSFGGPERAEDVMPFLRRVTEGRGVPEQRLAEVAEHYYAHGGASPLNARCRELLGLLEPRLTEIGLPAYWGNRNWAPSLDEALASMRDDGRSRALAFVTSAYGGYSSCRQYQDDIATALARAGRGAPQVDKLRLFYNHPGWVEAWSQSLTRALEDYWRAFAELGPPEVLFSAHSIPDTAARTSPYVEHVSETARLVATASRLGEWQLTWQSRSGAPGSSWLGPDICDVVRTSTSRGFVVVPIGFVCENLEITHDLDVDAAGVASNRGAAFVRARAVSSSEPFVEMVLSLVGERLGALRQASMSRAALGDAGPWPDTCPPGHCPAPTRPRCPTTHGRDNIPPG